MKHRKIAFVLITAATGQQLKSPEINNLRSLPGLTSLPGFTKREEVQSDEPPHIENRAAEPDRTTTTTVAAGNPGAALADWVPSINRGGSDDAVIQAHYDVLRRHPAYLAAALFSPIA
jgi:hypothetical protein